MKLSNLNDYLQTLATMGAIVGLLLVGYEVRQSNNIAVSQNTSANWTNWLDTANSRIESGLARTIAKSMTRPDELTLEEKVVLGFYFESWIYQYQHDIHSQYFLHDGGGDFELSLELTAQEIMGETPKVFGSRFSRAWLEKNREWIHPEFMEVVDAALENAPIGSDLAYWKSIDELAATME
jgi:hypothetical protein